MIEILSSPLLVSFDGSPFRNASTVDVLVAVNVVVNNCQVSVVVQLVQEFSAARIGLPLMSTSTVLVVPKMPVGL